MGNKNRARKGQHFNEPNYWQSADYNRRTRLLFQEWILQLAINRFRWVGLPDTCDARALELALHRNGSAAICYPSSNDLPPIWYSLPAVKDGKLTAYNKPTAWKVNGLAGGTHFKSDWEHGAWLYYSQSRFDIWNAIQLFSTRLAHLTRTEDINLFHQQMPLLIIGDDEMRRDMANIFKQISGGEPAIIANKTFDNLEITTIPVQQEYIGLDLHLALQNHWNTIFRYLGIEHLAFEKSERMISEEVRGNSYPTNLMLLDCLQARRDAAKWLNDNFGMQVEVYFNNDVESYNFNFINDLERITEAGLIAPAAAPIDQDGDGVVNEGEGGEENANV